MACAVDRECALQGLIPMSNIVYTPESNPFEAYSQLHNTLGRYRTTLKTLGGSRLFGHRTGKLADERCMRPGVFRELSARWA